MSKVVVPVSGGIDSSVLLARARSLYDKVYPITFIYGQRHIKEIEYAKKQAGDDYKEVNLEFFKDIKSALTDKNISVAKTKDVLGDAQTVNYVPFRNLIMLSIACSYAESVGADTVYHGAAQIDSQAGFWDGSIEFLNSVNELIKLNRKNRIKIEAPLIDKSKVNIIGLGYKYGVNFEFTWTCYEGEKKACGYCTACSSRIQGFLDFGVRDPIEYSRKDIPWEV